MAKSEDKISKKRKSLAPADEAAPADVDAEAPAAKKEKKEKDEFHVPLEAIAPIAAPLAGKKLSKKLFKTVKKGASALCGEGWRPGGRELAPASQLHQG